MTTLRDTDSSRLRLPLPIDSGAEDTPAAYADRVRVGLANPPSGGNSVEDWLAFLRTASALAENPLNRQALVYLADEMNWVDFESVRPAAGWSRRDFRTAVQQLLDAIPTLLALTTDLHPAPTSTGWAAATAVSEGGVTTLTGSNEPGQAAFRAVSATVWQVQQAAGVTNYADHWLLVRLPAATSSSQARVAIHSRDGDGTGDIVQEFMVNSFGAKGASADGSWSYYLWNHLLTDRVWKVVLQITASASHVGASQFSGQLTGSLANGIVNFDALAGAIAARLLPSVLGSAGQSLRVNSAGDGTEWYTPS